MPKIHSNTVKFILAGNVLLFIFTLLFQSIIGQGEVYSFLRLGGENTELILSGQVWRAVTSAFLHANIIHISANMYYFTELGELIHQYFDDKKLLIVYVFSAIMGATFSVVSVLLGLRYDSVSVGASGAVFGLLGMIMTSSWKSDRNPEGIALPIDYVQLLPYVVFSLIIGFLIPGINNSAHIGGLLGGMILGLIIRPNYGNVSGLPTPVKDGFYYLSLGIIAVSFLSLVIFNINLQS